MKYNEVAAKWWVEELRSASFQDFDVKENRNRSFNVGEDGDIAFWCVELGITQDKATKSYNEKMDAFEKRLSEAIKEAVEENGRIRLSAVRKDGHVRTDYILAVAINKTGVKIQGIRFDALMWVSADEVTVNSEVIFPKTKE